MLIQFENQDLLVVEKPAGVVVWPTKKVPEISLKSLLLEARPQQKKLGEALRFGIVHRLDKNTSGLVVVAKTDEAFDYLATLFRNREIDKEYMALVYGRIEKHGIIDKPLTKIGQRGISKVRVDDEGKQSKTEYWPVKHFTLPSIPSHRGRGSTSSPLMGEDRGGEGEGLDQVTLIRVKLHTGRTHQIRVHLAAIRHPVMGDDLYGKPASQKLNDILNRQFLHAAKLEFKLLDGTWLEVESPLPEELKEVLSKLNS